jgi:hypothetical protein
MTKHYYKQKQKQDKNYTKRKSQPKLQGNNTTNKHTRQMTAAERRVNHALAGKRNWKKALKAHCNGGARKGPSEDGGWQSTRKEIGGTLKWRGKFE